MSREREIILKILGFHGVYQEIVLFYLQHTFQRVPHSVLTLCSAWRPSETNLGRPTTDMSSTYCELAIHKQTTLASSISAMQRLQPNESFRKKSLRVRTFHEKWHDSPASGFLDLTPITRSRHQKANSWPDLLRPPTPPFPHITTTEIAIVIYIP